MMKKISIVFLFISLGFVSCEQCYDCKYATEDGTENTQERCGTKNEMDTFIPNQQDLGWECSKK